MSQRLDAEIVYEMIRTGDMSENEFVEWALEEFNEGYGYGRWVSSVLSSKEFEDVPQIAGTAA